MFDEKKFMRARLEPRTADVPVPDLKEFFGEKDECVWCVRGLSGHELGQVQEARDKSRDLSAVVEALFSVSSQEKAAAVKEMLGLTDNTPADIVRRLEMLRLGSVAPACNHELAVRLCTYFPIEFMTLTNKIGELTGQGAAVKKKPTASGESPASKTP